MNNFNICVRVVNVGQKRADRAPWPVEIETEIGRDKTAIVPVEIFRPEPPPVGWIAVLSGVLDSREWQGRRYLQLVVKSHEFLLPVRFRLSRNRTGSRNSSAIPKPTSRRAGAIRRRRCRR